MNHLTTVLIIILVYACSSIESLQQNSKNVFYNSSSKVFKLTKANRTILTGYLAQNLSTDHANVELKFGPDKFISLEFDRVRLEITASEHSDQITCQRFEWKLLEDGEQELEDCFDLTQGDWYGGSEMENQQFWPINQQVINSYKPYVTGLYDGASSVLERYWLSSNGVAIIVNRTVPLFVLKNQTHLCLKSQANTWPYSTRFPSDFTYDICHIDRNQSLDTYLNKLQLYVMTNFFRIPSGIPDELMFKRPIWSTWAVYKKSINSEVVKAFANEILANNFSNSQLEIDDKWQTFYGDFGFDRSKFPDISSLVRELNSMGFRTTLWVHPFADLISENFFVQSYNMYAVSNEKRSRPLLTNWWDSLVSIILDTTNPNSTAWFINNLNSVRNISGIDSFKFDAGEVGWLPRSFVLSDADQSPNQYSESYAKMASKLGPMIEVRVGSHTQDLPNFVRMLDKESRWGFDNGLRSVLTTALTFSILGYPFILPDMIGGNAYTMIDGKQTDLPGAFPDAQLFIRWTQLTAFLPSMQFSIPPWHYKDPHLTSICRRFTELHETLVFPQIKKCAIQATETGEPIIRPMWWMDNSDEKLLKINDQFMVGDAILVAPVLSENTYEREVYLPRGQWVSENGTRFDGPVLINASAPIETIPYFLHMN